jgi:hypothetical protein
MLTARQFDLEAYLDDSGTDGNTPIAVAACYISSKEQWDHFARNWDEVRFAEGFDVFHMCEFVAKREAGHKPFCDWDNTKKDRVYKKLASIINTRIRRGFAVYAAKRKATGQLVTSEDRQRFALEWLANNALPRPPLKSLIEHIDHIAKIAGVEHVSVSAPISTGRTSCRRVSIPALTSRGSRSLFLTVDTAPTTSRRF